MNPPVVDPTQLSDEQLLAHVQRTATDERRATAALVAALSELDARKLYLAQGCSSLFTSCTQVLHLSEHAAYGRIEAARVIRRCPMILAALADGAISLTAIGLLAPHLTADTQQSLLDAARHKSKREVEQIVATLRPQPDVPPSIRKVPAIRQAAPTGCPTTIPAAAAAPPASPRPAVVAPLAPERFKVQFTVSRETHDKLRRAQNLLRHVIPSGDPAAIFDRALTLLIAHTEKTKCAETTQPRRSPPSTSRTRHIPAAIRRDVWRRDAGQCAFVGANGRCTERGFLEFHHVLPVADGGSSTADNLELRCRAHNAYESERWFESDDSLFVRESRVEYGQLGPDLVREC